MPVIRKSADLRNKYGEISDFCHKYKEPVFITRNGEGDLAVMSMETYETMSGRQELYAMINEGLEQVRQGKTKPAREALAALRKKLRI
jgi:prevent-host-death family protein